MVAYSGLTPCTSPPPPPLLTLQLPPPHLPHYSVALAPLRPYCDLCPDKGPGYTTARLARPGWSLCEGLRAILSWWERGGSVKGILRCEKRLGVAMGSPAVYLQLPPHTPTPTPPHPCPKDSRRHSVTAVAGMLGRRKECFPGPYVIRKGIHSVYKILIKF